MYYGLIKKQCTNTLYSLPHYQTICFNGVCHGVWRRAAERNRKVRNNHYNNVLPKHQGTGAPLSLRTKVAIISLP